MVCDDAMKTRRIGWREGGGNMAETESRILAEYDCGGARVCIVADERARAPEPSACPAWVQVGRRLAGERIREYAEAVGHLPSPELLERFNAAMEQRLNEFIREPRKHPWTPLTLAEFEKEEQAGE